MSYAPGKSLAKAVDVAFRAAFREFESDMNTAASEVDECDDVIREAGGTIDAIGCPESTHMDWYNDLDDATGRRDRYIEEMYTMKDAFRETLNDIERLVEQYYDRIEDVEIPESN